MKLFTIALGIAIAVPAFSQQSPTSEVKPVNMIGKWVYANSRGVDATINIVFGKDGGFSFKCPGAASKGKYTTEGRVLTLEYVEVDGQKVEPGTMRLRVDLDAEGGFKIGKYGYVRING